jgi:DNA replication ATP-dependent helicase Dna2
LIKRGKSVLLTSYTHSAVDTICRKLVKEASTKLLRIGKKDRVHSDIHPWMMKEAGSVEELECQLLQPNVVATTCLSISHALFGKRKFDCCIVDEASQITLLTCLGPLRFANVFVLVGDPLQLPPLVRNVDAKEGGLDVSLFDVLQKAHPQSVVKLQVQYRMSEDIMMLSNELVYQGQLRCGNRLVQNSSLELPTWGHLQQVLLASTRRSNEVPSRDHGEVEPCWISKILGSETRALFLNTDLLQDRGETRSHEQLLENTVEADIITQVCAAFVMAGVKQEEIAIITPYRQQLRALMKRLGDAATGNDRIEVLTVDKSQGRDKDVVLISLVRSGRLGGQGNRRGGQGEEGIDDDDDDDADIGRLLNDVKRINVALTRARKKLIIVGSKRTMRRSNLLRRLWNLMESNQWTMDLSQEQYGTHKARLDRVFQPSSKTSSLPSSKGSPDEERRKSRAKSHVLLRGRPVLQDVYNELL